MSQWPDQQEVKAMAKAREHGIVILGNQVFEGSKYSPEIVHFTRQKYLLLNHYHAGLTLAEAAAKVTMDLEEAAEFIDSPKAVAWLEREALKDYTKRKWADGGEWILAGDECLQGKRHLAKDQQIVFQAFGDRFMPKSKESGDEKKTVINFNFTAEAVKEAFQRQTAIEAELVKEQIA